LTDGYSVIEIVFSYSVEVNQKGDDITPMIRGLSERLGLVLKQRGLSQSEAARRTGIPLTTLNKWMDRSAQAPNPRADNLLALRKVLDVSIDWLLTGQGAREVFPTAAAEILERLFSWLRASLGSKALDPGRIDITRPQGDAFAPEYGPHDLFVIEKTKAIPSHDEICLVSYGRTMEFRRVVHQADGSLLLTAPNPATPDLRIAAAEVKAHGRVIAAVKALGRIE
jgi:transcriptional regulator with XRE-family HTH domain